ncbi:hypothetical protein L7F22_038068 [Adiantum nelumboides]|nr:hypothetical protein [Adiantum nelumboides]
MPIKDQGGYGSCWAFATISVVESANAISIGDLISLYEQELVSCDGTNYGCDGGEMDLAIASKSRGVSSKQIGSYGHGAFGDCPQGISK